MSSAMDDRPAVPAVELRIHGVGGSTPAGLLGVASAAETIRVDGAPISAFWARRDEPGVEGYVWGGLTGRLAFLPFSLFLLPLTLLNVAGFLHRYPRYAFIARVQRRAVRLLGYVLTAAWTLWVSTIVIEQLAWRGLELPAVMKVLVGTVGCLALGAWPALLDTVGVGIMPRSRFGCEGLRRLRD